MNSARRRSISRAAFGQDYRLELMLAVADHESGLVTLSEMASRLELTPSQIQGALRSLTTVGLLVDAPATGSRHRYLMRQPSAAWDWARELDRATQTHDSARR